MINIGGGKSVERTRNRWKEVIQRDAANLLRIRNRKAAARDKRSGGRRLGRPWP
jgi:hypothetical protein